MSSSRCPCLSGLTYDDCCGPLHAGVRTAQTPEALMRSRFSAFAVGDESYLARTWHPRTRPTDLSLDPGVRWYRLDILATSDGGARDARGTVEFRAFFKSDDGPGNLHERSRFEREHGNGGAWLYVDGDIR